ncbi:hypothetical protein NEHOM01_1491 [Nematocida homosporus]|uniref:uncharacterized protein n=1 Tax=Nematocida homosporus TaxID=1912981 RepID=UPI002220F82B|nr:uncharacterized protein NEHOM01_1491 [Nematocida homosporus]KAI5186479.1 hypothetical protein NEHOM01_1491 [Nematocida homosporus]
MSDFKTFLLVVQDKSQSIQNLAKDAQSAEDLVSEYIISSGAKARHLSNQLAQLSADFFHKAGALKNELEAFTQSNPTVFTDRKKAVHLQALFKKLSLQIELFNRTKHLFTSAATKKESITEETQNTHLLQSHNTFVDLSLPQAPTTTSAAANEELAKNKNLRLLLLSLSDLESLSIELNTIIESSGDPIDRISLKTTEMKSVSLNTNRTLEQGIRRRTRRMKLKRVFILLVILILILLAIFFGTKLLEFFLKCKGLFK